MKKRINAKKKGKRNELKTKKYLIEKGYMVELVKNTKYNHSDFFNLFDAIAVNEHHFRLIQVKSNRVAKKAIIKLQKAIGKFPACATIELWSWKDYKKEPEIYVFGN